MARKQSSEKLGCSMGGCFASQLKRGVVYHLKACLPSHQRKSRLHGNQINSLTEKEKMESK
jgi:hypothetical protein